MKFQPLKRAPVLLALVVLLFVCFFRFLAQESPDRWDFFERLERQTYDLRVQKALDFPAPAATNLAFITMADSSVDYINKEYSYQFPWPRLVYGHLLDELAAQGAKAVAFDVIFGQLNQYDPSVQMPDGGLTNSDDFFALQARAAGNVILAATPDIYPPGLFATNCLAVGDVSTDKDPDGSERRVKAFNLIRRWHPYLRKAAADPEVQLDLDHAQFKPGKIIFPQTGTTNLVELPVDAQTNFTLSDLYETPPGVAPKAPAFTTERLWHMGIVLAAQELKLDLKNAIVDLPHGTITLRGAGGIERVIPVDAAGYFYVDWRLVPGDPRILQTPIENLLEENRQRLQGNASGLPDSFRNRLIVVGSSAQGNNLTDRGATPLTNDTLLVSTYWNVANSVVTGRFVRRTPLPVELAISVLLGLLVAWATLQMRTRIIYASLAVLGLILAYTALTFFTYIAWRLWLPLFFPVVGAMLPEHVALIIYLVMVEQREKRRVRSVFSKIVSPAVVNELLEAEHFSMVGSRREVTVLFADVRGFTKLTDEMQEKVVEYATQNQLDPAAAEKCFDESARETLETVNLYLTKVADAVIAHQGTLDKYIGDCVMAFWGAPLNDEKHALGCVRAAIDAQRAICQLNQIRVAENAAREAENPARVAAGLRPKDPLRALQLGTGINTGTVIVGLMGSGEHISNYTIFGREVNLASRLEGVSGSGRIIIGETTYNHLARHDPALAATCVEQPSVTPKGFRTAVRIFEVPWQQPTTPGTVS